VVIPGFESADVIASLREDRELIEPARLASERIESGIATAYTELQRYTAFHDSTSFARLRRIAGVTDADIASLQQLTLQISEGDSVVAHVNALAAQVGQFQKLAGIGPEESGAPASADIVERRIAARESVLVATARVQSDLARLIAAHRSAVVVHERRGLRVNVALVLAAFLAMATMLEATRRERRSARADSALRLAAEALAEAPSTAEVARQIAQCAIEVFRGRSAALMSVDGAGAGSPRVVVASTAGEADPFTELAGPYRGSIAERSIEYGRARVLDVEIGGRTVLGLVIPLGVTASPNGAVVVTRSPGRQFRHDEILLGATFGRLAQLAHEKVQLLEQARAARAQLERAMESRNRLMRGFSHDVKNPLGAADGYAGLIEAEAFGPITNDQRRSLGRLRLAIQRALSLIDDLHQLARVETGDVPVHLERTELSHLMLGLAEEYRAAADARGLELVVDVDAGLPTAMTDGSRVRQIVANLLSNAIKYTDEGSVTLRVTSQQSGGSHDRHILIRVTDTGPGIPSDKLGSIFDEFTRLSDRRPGAGVGLAISRHLASAIGGQLDATSEVGRGSTFTLTIPLGAEGESTSRAGGEHEPALGRAE
jgi:signal transduction histidine kinase